MTLTPSRQVGPKQPVLISDQKYREVLSYLDHYKKLDKAELKSKAAQSSRIQLGWDEHVDKWSMIQFILENSYGRSTLEAFFKMYEIEKKALKAAKRKARRQRK